MTPQRIAYLTGEYPRVTDTFVQREVAALRKLGMDVETFSVRRTGTTHHVGPEQQAEAKTTHYLLPPKPIRMLTAHLRAVFTAPGRYLSAACLAWKTRQPGLSGGLYQLYYFIEAGLVVDLMRQLNREHLHNHFANSSCSVAMLAATMGGFPFSFTMHGPAIFFEPQLWRIDEKIARAKFVACISHFCRSQGMVFADPAHWPKMRIVHCGVEPGRYAARHHTGRGDRLIYVGRLAAVKGLPVLLDALVTMDKHVKLTVVGDGPDRPMLEGQTQRLGLSDRVEFVGYKSQDEVGKLLGQSDVFVMSSFAEGVPVVLMEAMASGLPVVATRIAGVGELVDDGQSGYLVPPGDTIALAKKLNLLVNDALLRSRMGVVGRTKVAAEFDLALEAQWLRSVMCGESGDELRPVRDTPMLSQSTSASADERGAA